MTWTCGNCGTINTEDTDHCVRCGAARGGAPAVAVVATSTPTVEPAPPTNGSSGSLDMMPPTDALAGAVPPGGDPDGAGTPPPAEPGLPGELEPETGTATAARTLRRSSTDPPNQCGSHRTEIADAPPAS